MIEITIEQMEDLLHEAWKRVGCAISKRGSHLFDILVERGILKIIEAKPERPWPRVTTGQGLLSMLGDFRNDGKASFFVCDLPGVCTSEALSRACWALALACCKGDPAMPDMISVEGQQRPDLSGPTAREFAVTSALGYAENILPKIRTDLAKMGNLLAVTLAYPKTTLAFANGEIVLDLSRNPATSAWRVG